MAYYPYISNSTMNASSDLTQVLVYANTVTGGAFGPMMLLSFFLIALIGGYFAQLRFSGRAKFDVAFLAASFASFGLSMIMALTLGLLGIQWVMIAFAVTIIALFWVLFAAHETA